MSEVNDVVSDIRKVARCVYLACETTVAADVAVKCKAVADSHDKLTAENKRLREALLEIECLPGVRIDESSSIARNALSHNGE